LYQCLSTGRAAAGIECHELHNTASQSAGTARVAKPDLQNGRACIFLVPEFIEYLGEPASCQWAFGKRGQ
jgi:hypothetical protein